MTSQLQTPSQPLLDLRPPSQVMRLSRMGAFHQTRLSFVRCLLRRIATEQWRLTRSVFQLDQQGYGTVVYKVKLPATQQICSLVAFSHHLDAEDRSDRVIAERWDATFALVSGEPSAQDIARLADNVPKQEAGRCSPKEFVLSRANKSVRLFDYVTDCLAQGQQPEMDALVKVGYLMRTTAVYGNGKFGLSDLANTFAEGLFSRPFEAEMLTVYLIREFTFDLIEHCAKLRNPNQAVRLAPKQRQALGIGNATGLGMAPFLVTHPMLIHRWMLARETAIARVLAEPQTTQVKRQTFYDLLQRAIHHVAEWKTDDQRQTQRIEQLHRELQELSHYISDSVLLTQAYPWRALSEHAKTHGSEELQELLHSLIIELYGELVDELADSMGDAENQRLVPGMTLSKLKQLIDHHFAWALAIDFNRPAAEHFFWYRSAEKEEPRLGERFNESGAELEMHLGIAREVKNLYQTLSTDDISLDQNVATFLMQHPQWRLAVRRVQLAPHYSYGEIQDNLLAANCLPIDMLRCKLSFFGAIKFDPKSDRWTRITLYQGAPSFEQLNQNNVDSWAFPVFLQ